jgi:hypothetical protein
MFLVLYHVMYRMVIRSPRALLTTNVCGCNRGQDDRTLATCWGEARDEISVCLSLLLALAEGRGITGLFPLPFLDWIFVYLIQGFFFLSLSFSLPFSFSSTLDCYNVGASRPSVSRRATAR